MLLEESQGYQRFLSRESEVPSLLQVFIKAKLFKLPKDKRQSPVALALC